jgi:hypothetical protein
VPDSGYVFAGWSHPAYVSLKGVEVPADSGVFDLDTLPIYGDVELTARFAEANLNKVPNLVKVDDDASEEAVISQIWASGGELFVQPAETPSILRIYNANGVFIRQQTILAKGITSIRMSGGVYIATLNNGLGVKLRIEN